MYPCCECNAVARKCQGGNMDTWIIPEDVANLPQWYSVRVAGVGIDGGRVTIVWEWRAALVIITQHIIAVSIITAVMLPPDIVSFRSPYCLAYPASLSFRNLVRWGNRLWGFSVCSPLIRSPFVPHPVHRSRFRDHAYNHTPFGHQPLNIRRPSPYPCYRTATRTAFRETAIG